MFVQIIEGHTSDAEGLKRRGEVWQTELRPGAEGFLGSTGGVGADGRAILVARFESEEAARANSDRPEQGQWWAETEKYYDGEVTFTESSDVDEWMGGGSNNAGFVQVMKMGDVDRAGLEAMDRAFEGSMNDLRPDVMGGLRIWTGPSSCVDVVYFTSEQEARAGEVKEMPPELQEAMAPMAQAMETTEFLDLSDPWLN